MTSFLINLSLFHFITTLLCLLSHFQYSRNSATNTAFGSGADRKVFKYVLITPNIKSILG